MRAEILTIGDELCRGEIVDTNAAWLAGRLWDLDVTVAWMTSCRDDDADIRSALTEATRRADLVLVSGGLGPTEDDRTVDVVAALTGVEPVVDEAARGRMVRRFAAAKFKLTPNNLRQVRVPAGARVHRNPAGSAPGFEIPLNGVPIFCMPGVPREVRGIFDTGVKERVVALREARGEAVERIARRIYRVFGMGESHVSTALEGVSAGVLGASIHYQVRFPEVWVKLVIRDSDSDVCAARLDEVDGAVRERLGASLYGIDDDSLPAAAGRALLARGATVATAESCTGGLVGALFTEVAGSSAYYVGGAVTYTNEEKTRQLGVDPAIFVADGAVSEACVTAMACGARDRLGADFAVATSGIAGPGGGTAEKPVGIVWLAVAGPAGVRAKRMFWPSDRDRIRTLAAYWAVSMVLTAAAEPAESAGDAALPPGATP